MFVALGAISGCKNESARPALPGQPPRPRADEHYAWEELPSGQFKPVKKDYFLNKELCRNVIDVLNDMSTQQSRSNWALSHTTDSTFECWPASVNPNDYYKKNSIYSDSPAVTSPVIPHPDMCRRQNRRPTSGCSGLRAVICYSYFTQPLNRRAVGWLAAKSPALD